MYAGLGVPPPLVTDPTGRSVLTALAVVEKVSLKKATSSLPGFGVFLSEIVVLLFALVFSGVVGFKLMVRHPRALNPALCPANPRYPRSCAAYT